MLVTRLEAIDKKKYRVYIDYEFAFVLYVTDIRANKLEEEHEISKEQYEDILVNTVLRRGKQKALAILKFMDRSENELRLKLIQSDYTQEIVNYIIDYVKSYKYIDDERFTSYYIRSKKDSKSRRQIEMELYQKGIDKTIIEEAMEIEYTSDDNAILKAIAKKTSNLEELTPEQRKKLAASLYRKGFKSEDIRKHLS